MVAAVKLCTVLELHNAEFTSYFSVFSKTNLEIHPNLWFLCQ